MTLRFGSFLVFLSGCVAVLDLDATPNGSGGEDGTGGADTSSATSVGGSDDPPQVGGAGTVEECDRSSVAFDGSAYLRIDRPDHNPLDFDDKISIGAWVLPDAPSSDDEEHFVFSRLNDYARVGYSLLLRSEPDGWFPELRVYVDGEVCGCTSNVSVSPDRWTHVAGMYFEGHLDEADAAVWVDGQRSCIAECGEEKVTKAHATPTVGAGLDGTRGFFRGRLDGLYVRNSDEVPPPQWDGPSCDSGIVFALAFDRALTEVSAPDCGSDDLWITLGGDGSLGDDEPEWVPCP